MYYDDDWSTLSYFVSTQKTAFSVTLLQNYDAELLIGQVSYKQRANIYNYIHGYFAAQVEVEDNTLSMESERESDTRYAYSDCYDLRMFHIHEHLAKGLS